jgi:murein DD-endopeptidase MepM/ murein hydrolase activator NlpD
MVKPVPGHKSATAFGERGPHWSCDKIDGEGIHTGIDFPAPVGTEVVAARAGVTAHVDFGKAFGTLQLAVHCADGTEDFYAHMSDRVAGGREVAAGEKVGEVGDQGNVTGPHLHFERHKSQGPPWSCGIVTDPSPSIQAPASGAPVPKTLGVPAQTAPVRLSKLRFGVMDAGSVRRLQRVLNKHGAAGDPQLPTTGNYLSQTDEAVRRCQQRHGFGQDPAGASFVGAHQAAHLFGDRFNIIDDLESAPGAGADPAHADA